VCYTSSIDREVKCVHNFGGEPLVKQPPGMLRRQDNIDRDVSEVGCEDGRWMELVQECVLWQ
jgi:hypothetical protein